MVGRIINVNIEVTDDDELMGSGSSKGWERTEVVEKAEFGLENAYDEGGR